MKKKSLNGTWQLYMVKPEDNYIQTPTQLEHSSYQPISALVPGNVELDLIAAGLLPKDIFKGMNVLQAEAYELYDWWYLLEFETECSFDIKQSFLQFEGVDTIADYWLNGHLLGSSENMLIEHRFETGQYLLQGQVNKLYVHIKSAVVRANQINYDIHNIYCQPNPNNEGISLRKAAHTFGWDIFPRAVSAGIWREVTLGQKDPVEIGQIYCNTISLSEEEATVRFCWELEIPDRMLKEDLWMEIEGTCRDSFFYEKRKIYFKMDKTEIKIEKPYLWWPNGYGDADLYDVSVTVYCNGEKVTVKELQVGVRTVRLERTETTDGINGKFCFFINNTPVMCRGSNWVPLDVYHSRDLSRLDKAMELVKDVGCNILRCWGGNVYESDAFYEFCDRNGIMIWQDFSMACGGYPQDEEFRKQMACEVTAVIRRLRNHACIILWAGDNECDAMMSEFGSNPFMNQLTRRVIPECLYRNDVSRPYLPSSPCYSENTYKENRFDLLSENHLWGFRDYYKSDFYAKSNAHFVSETGYHGCPSRKSLERFLDKDYLWPTKNEQWNLHSTDQRNRSHRIDIMWNQIEQLFAFVPQDLDTFAEASQYSQAEAKKFFVERVRYQKPVKTGVIWWNLLDGWPQISDAVVDYYFEKKIAYYYIRNSQQSFCMFMDEVQNSTCRLIACNDTLQVKKGTYRVWKGLDEKLVCEGTFEVEKNGKAVLKQIPVLYSEKELFMLEWEMDGQQFCNHYLAGFPPFSFEWYRKCYEKLKQRYGIEIG